MIELGYYKHSKGNIYIVLDNNVIDKTNNDEVKVMYRDVRYSKLYIRSYDDFKNNFTYLGKNVSELHNNITIEECSSLYRK